MKENKEETLDELVKDKKEPIKVSLVEFVYYIFNIGYIAVFIYFYKQIWTISIDNSVHVSTIYKYYLRILIFQIICILVSLLLISFANKENLKRKSVLGNIFYIINFIFLIAIIVGFNFISVALLYFPVYINVIRILATIDVILVIGYLPIKSMLKMTKEIDKIY